MTDIAPEELRILLKYDKKSGLLTWRERPGDTRFNNSFAHKIAGGIHTSKRGGRKSIIIKIKGKSHIAHRVIWAMVTGAWPEHEIDHKNHDATDNRWSNLREATRAEQVKNLPMSSRNTSGRVGVFYSKSKGAWVAKVGNTIIGQRKYKKDAVKLRNEKLREHGFHRNHGKRKEISCG